MKKLLVILSAILILLTFTLPVFAWSVPEDIASDDSALIYFAQVLKVYPDEETALVSPVKVIKGDIPVEGLHLVKKCTGLITPGNVYIFLSTEENIQQTYAFSPTSYDTDTLSFSRVDGNNERLIRYINEGKYKSADAERTDRINSEIKGKNSIKLSELLGLTESTELPISVKNTFNKSFDIDYNAFLSLCDEITAYEIKDGGAYSEYRQMFYYAGEKAVTLTTDAKIIISDNSFHAEYYISGADKNKLLSLFPEEKADLPTITMGSFVIVAAIAFILFSIMVFISLPVLIKKKKKKK